MAIVQKGETYNFRELAVLAAFSIILAVPPLFWGGKSAAGQLIFFTLLLCAAIFVKKVKGRFEARGAAFAFAMLALFIFAAGISVLYSPEKYSGLTQFLNLLAGSILCFLVYNFIDSKDKIRYFGLLILGLGILLSVIGVYDFCHSGSFGFLRLTSTFYSHIPFGEFMTYPLMLSFCLLFSPAAKGRRKILLAGACVLFSVVFYFDQSRGAWISFFAVLFLLAAFFGKKLFAKESLGLLAAIILAGALIVAGFLNLKSYQASRIDVKNVVYSAETASENAAVARIQFWQRALDIFAGRPVIGGGLGSYGYFHRLYLKPPFYYSTDPHNFYLKLLAEGGLALFCAFMAFAAGLASKLYKLLLRIKNKPNKMDLPDAVLVGMAGGLIAGALNNGVNFGWSYPANLIIFFFIAGIILKAAALIDGARNAKNSGRGDIFFEKSWPAIFLASALLFCFGIGNFLADSAYLDGIYYSVNGKPAEALASIKNAAGFNAFNPDYRAQLASFYSDIAINSGNREDFDTAIQYADDAIYWSDSSENSLLKGRIYFAKGDRAAAASYYQIALSKYPFGLDAALESASLKLFEEKYADVNLMLAKILPFYKKEHILSPYYIVPDKKAVLAKIAKLHNANGAAYAKLGNNAAAQAEFAAANAFEK